MIWGLTLHLLGAQELALTSVVSPPGQLLSWLLILWRCGCSLGQSGHLKGPRHPVGQPHGSLTMRASLMLLNLLQTKGYQPLSVQLEPDLCNAQEE